MCPLPFPAATAIRTEKRFAGRIYEEFYFMRRIRERLIREIVFLFSNGGSTAVTGREGTFTSRFEIFEML